MNEIKKQEIYQIKPYDEHLNVLVEVLDCLDYDYLRCNKGDKIWLKREKDGYIYNATLNTLFKTDYNEIHFQTNDKNNLNEYGYGINYKDKLLQIIDENFNVLIESVPYETLGINPRFGQFAYRYLNGFLLIRNSYIVIANYEIPRNIIIDRKRNLLYDKQNTTVTSIGHYFQIIEKEGTLYFDTLTGEFSSKGLASDNDFLLLETKEQFEIDENGNLKLIQSLKKE